jgi:hypothetical protein
MLSPSELQAAREANIARLEGLGVLDPNCKYCQQEYYPFYRFQWVKGKEGPMGPRHTASPRCQSGKRPHCTCSTCF